MESTDKFYRFYAAQENSYERAFNELAKGRKASHWMWYIFPQLKGLGQSEISMRYSLNNLEEAQRYLNTGVLGERLIRISELLMKVENRTAHDIFGSPDDMKLRSSMTLFSLVPGADPVFRKVLDKFYSGKPDSRTLQLLSPGP